MKVSENNELKAKLDATVTQPIIVDKGFSQNAGKRQRKWNLSGETQNTRGKMFYPHLKLTQL